MSNPVEFKNRIFCNRALNMRKIKVGTPMNLYECHHRSSTMTGKAAGSADLARTSGLFELDIHSMKRQGFFRHLLGGCSDHAVVCHNSAFV